MCAQIAAYVSKKGLAMSLFSCYTVPDDSVAQWIECVSPEHKVAGSTPATVTTTPLSPGFSSHILFISTATLYLKQIFLLYILLSKNTYFCVFTWIVSSFMLSAAYK